MTHYTSEDLFALDSAAISRRMYASTITPHSSWHRWQYRAPQGSSLPFWGFSRRSSRLRLSSGLISSSVLCIQLFLRLLTAHSYENKSDRVVTGRM